MSVFGAKNINFDTWSVEIIGNWEHALSLSES